MFISTDSGKAVQYVSGNAAQLMLALPGYRVATAMEAAECVSRLVCGGAAEMHPAAADFTRIYGRQGAA